MRRALALLMLLGASQAVAFDRPDEVLRVYQFPADAIPRIDGDASDWDRVPASYVIRSDQFAADNGSGRRPDPASLRATIKVGWVKSMNRLYILYEAWDDHWDFASEGLDQDILEMVVDGDRSGGPLIARFHPDIAPPPAPRPTLSDGRTMTDEDAWFGFQNRHAQNYHIFTPARDKDWAMAWGPQAPWLKRLPYSNMAYRYAFKPGQAGKLVAEFWITPFDLADGEGPGRSVETTLAENAIVGLGFAIIDRDGPGKSSFWNLSSPKHTMYGRADELRAFRLMPPDPAPAIKADWSFVILDRATRVVAFRDDSAGTITHRRWDFGDGETSTDTHPTHRYAKPGKYVVVLHTTGPAGTSTLSRVWDVSFIGDPPK